MGTEIEKESHKKKKKRRRRRRRRKSRPYHGPIGLCPYTVVSFLSLVRPAEYSVTDKVVPPK